MLKKFYLSRQNSEIIEQVENINGCEFELCLNGLEKPFEKYF